MKVDVVFPLASMKYLREVRQLNFPSEPIILQGLFNFKCGSFNSFRAFWTLDNPKVILRLYFCWS